MPSITWFRRNKDPISLDNVLLTNDTDGQLNLINITRHQTGFYECQASNGIHGHIASKEVQVHVLCKYFFDRIRQDKIEHDLWLEISLSKKVWCVGRNVEGRYCLN